MELTLQNNDSGIFIKNYEHPKIYIKNEVYTSNIIITNKEVIKWIDNIDLSKATINDFDNIIKHEPEIILLGTGQILTIPMQETIEAVNQQGIGLDYMITESACKTFNLLVSENRKVAAMLIL